ncbi:hypothetical protein FQA39_LY01629 [Lamprigera yunnana]|nr:hypothetical protein FQA39_LY01629 [Lamprigera yunnana]
MVVNDLMSKITLTLGLGFNFTLNVEENEQFSQEPVKAAGSAPCGMASGVGRKDSFLSDRNPTGLVYLRRRDMIQLDWSVEIAFIAINRNDKSVEDLKVGDYILALFVSTGKRAVVHYNYVVKILQVLEGDDFEVQCLKSLNETKTTFKFIEND